MQYYSKMDGPVAPNPANPDNNDNNDENQNNDKNDDNNVLAGLPKAPPQQPPNQPAPQQLPNSPIVCVVLALDSWNYCSGEQAQQSNICKIPQSSLYS